MEDLSKRDPEIDSILAKIVKSTTTDLERVELFHQFHRNFLNSKVYQDYVQILKSSQD